MTNLSIIIIPTDFVEEKDEKVKKKRAFVVNGIENDPIPLQFHHVMDSERNVKKSIYLALKAFLGIGLSNSEVVKAVQIVSNCLLDREFKIARFHRINRINIYIWICFLIKSLS